MDEDLDESEEFEDEAPVPVTGADVLAIVADFVFQLMDALRGFALNLRQLAMLNADWRGEQRAFHAQAAKEIEALTGGE